MTGLSLSVNPEAFDVSNLDFRVINTAMAGQFNLHMKISFVTGLVLAMPYVLWEFWRFVKPALTQREIAATHRFVFWISACFFTGLLFGYFVIVPALGQLLHQLRSQRFDREHDRRQSIPFDRHRRIAGLGAGVPAAAAGLLPDPYGLVSSSFLKRYRRHAFVGLLVIAAIITPPDIFSLILVIIPLYWLYELSIRLSSRIERRDAADGAVRRCNFRNIR